jgi:hypothetical protein
MYKYIVFKDTNRKNIRFYMVEENLIEFFKIHIFNGFIVFVDAAYCLDTIDSIL